jgi:hypothetical protein
MNPCNHQLPLPPPAEPGELPCQPRLAQPPLTCHLQQGTCGSARQIPFTREKAAVRTRAPLRG